MNANNKKIKALGLCSGGLDSILSALVLRDQGIEVAWISFETPFFNAEKARAAANHIQVPLTVKKITPVYMEMLKHPPAGFGKNMNPCMDCHTLMFKLAGELMIQKKFDFLFSGEVLGQRPMSQTKSALRYVEKHSGYDGYIVRPLSAKLLPETRVEIAGLVKRELLLDIKGRSRKPQIELAKKYNVTSYPAPAGGCLLTDKGYSVRLKDLFAHQVDHLETDLDLLKFGRHIRLTETAKIVVGRTRQDNDQIMACYVPEKDVLVKLESRPGPVVLVPNGGSKEVLLKAAAICAGYSKAASEPTIHAVITFPGGQETVSVTPILPNDIKMFLL